jgi:uncharacterized protein (TIGR02271 family)
MDKQQQSAPQAQQQASSSNAAEATQVIPVLQEQVTVGKRVVETGKVRISKTVTEDQTSVSIPLMHEEYDVERVPVNQVVETPPPALRYEGETAIIPVLREVLVVQKHYEITEEIRITKRKSETTDTQQVNLRKEEVHIERSRPGTDQEATH